MKGGVLLPAGQIVQDAFDADVAPLGPYSPASQVPHPLHEDAPGPLEYLPVTHDPHHYQKHRQHMPFPSGFARTMYLPHSPPTSTNIVGT